MKRIILLFVCSWSLVIQAQKPADVKTDSIPELPDTVNFINNKDLAEFTRILRLVMTNAEFSKADPITQYEMIVNNAGQVFVQSRQRWELKNKIKKNGKTL